VSKLTELARNAPCLVRLPCCNSNPETTVAAHFRDVSIGAGMGIKPHDIFSAHACHACHEVIDGRRSLEGWSRDAIRLAHAKGVMRTIDKLILLGKVKT
jgi:Putative nuclease YbcO